MPTQRVDDEEDTLQLSLPVRTTRKVFPYPKGSGTGVEATKTVNLFSVKWDEVTGIRRKSRKNYTIIDHLTRAGEDKSEDKKGIIY